MSEQSMSKECRCEEALERLEEYIDSEITEIDAGRLRAHLEECASCFGEAELERRVKELLRRSCCETAPETLRMRVRTEITVLRTRLVPPA
ncbi:MAG TPA: mycothiol system anti-sigma-R factor [Actinotalea caeni]|uniref:mycothiol system anti-sigma-R factor n=1 Tax=Actinotalea caeni TaxID=1348467 RepID=UPI0012E2E230|nr:mycothiol system anti-sigma-R factor [Actinotalea caeni]HLV54251.1 mycothiol system anti-sigma-R factor [Actinotalea caeni]